MKKVCLFASFFVLAPVLLFVSLIYLSFLSYSQKGPNISANVPSSVAFAALPSSENVFSGNIFFQDARTEIVRQFFKKYNSPLEPYAQNVVDAADVHGLDFRLVPAIGMQESNLCHKAPKSSFNCWGFGIYGKKITVFDDYQQAIDIVTKTLSREYKDKGLVTPKEIMSKYTPSNTGAWAESVGYFMSSLQL